MEMKKVKSSNVNAIGFDEESGSMTVEFNGGRQYTYENVPRKVYDQALGAESVGKFLNTNVKGVYPFKKGKPTRSTLG